MMMNYSKQHYIAKYSIHVLQYDIHEITYLTKPYNFIAGEKADDLCMEERTCHEMVIHLSQRIW